jgi:hypothetical protein
MALYRVEMTWESLVAGQDFQAAPSERLTSSGCLPSHHVLFVEKRGTYGDLEGIPYGS